MFFTINDRLQKIEEIVTYNNQLFENHKSIIELIKSDDFLKAPASTKHHGCYEGGLFDHSYNVATILADLTVKNQLTWQRPESPYLIGFLHDLCKIDNYVPNLIKIYDEQDNDAIKIGYKQSDDEPYKYNKESLYKGHGTKSVIMACQYESLTPEEIACIVYHMGAFTDKEEWNDYTKAIHKYPNVLWTHHADMIATHIMEV